VKNLTVILLLVIFAFTSGGAALFFSILQNNNQTEMVNYINNDLTKQDITTLTLSIKKTNEIVWINANNFVYEGMSYYFINSISQLNSVTLYCFKNLKGTILNNKINNYHKKSNTKKGKNIPVFIFFFFSIEKSINHYFWNNNTLIDTKIKHELKRFAKIIPPPPKVFLVK
jgi:hypothetical protein